MLEIQKEKTKPTEKTLFSISRMTSLFPARAGETVEEKPRTYRFWRRLIHMAHHRDDGEVAKLATSILDATDDWVDATSSVDICDV